jgi:hypothetical protein
MNPAILALCPRCGARNGFLAVPLRTTDIPCIECRLWCYLWMEIEKGKAAPTWHMVAMPF